MCITNDLRHFGALLLSGMVAANCPLFGTPNENAPGLCPLLTHPEAVWFPLSAN